MKLEGCLHYSETSLCYIVIYLLQVMFVCKPLAKKFNEDLFSRSKTRSKTWNGALHIET